MDIVLTGFAFLSAALCAGVMGFAIQRGATCTVAAVDELVSKRSWLRIASLIEAALWVAGGLLVAQTLHMLPTMPSGYPLSRSTVFGGVLLGLGAFVNQCSAPLRVSPRANGPTWPHRSASTWAA